MCDNRREEKSNREKRNGKEPGCVTVRLGVSLKNMMQLGATRSIQRNVSHCMSTPKYTHTNLSAVAMETME